MTDADRAIVRRCRRRLAVLIAVIVFVQAPAMCGAGAWVVADVDARRQWVIPAGAAWIVVLLAQLWWGIVVGVRGVQAERRLQEAGEDPCGVPHG